MTCLKTHPATGAIPMTNSSTDFNHDPRIERTRRAVMDAGIALMYEFGPDGVNHAAVATAAGVSRTTMYKYWPTRAKLLLDIFGCVEHDELAELSGDIRTDLMEMLGRMRRSFNDVQERRMFTSLLAQAQWDDDVSEARAGARAIPVEYFSRIVDDGIAQGVFRRDLDPIVAAGRLVGPLMFAALAMDDVDSVDIESLVDDWLASARPD
ncbi:MAG: TetR/AcrR family transcriptional regulator [Ilumatobacter sp.]